MWAKVAGLSEPARRVLIALSTFGLALAPPVFGAVTGLPEAALDPAREAAGIYRELAEANPDSYLPDLASVLNNLGVWLGTAGLREAALDHAREAVAIRQQLAAANPAGAMKPAAGSR